MIEDKTVISAEPTLRKVSIIQGHDNPSFEISKPSNKSDHIEIGPVHKKSVLHNSFNVNNLLPIYLDGKQINGDSNLKKYSISGSTHSKQSGLSENNEDERSWFYAFCLKCHGDDTHPSWEPRCWTKYCPHPFGLSYRMFSRWLALILIGIFAWILLYSFVGETVTPGGHLFQLIILTLCAYLGGCVVVLVTLPRLIGMLIVGIILQNVGIVDIDDSFSDITRDFRHVALTIILIRAGLDLDPSAMKRLKFTVVRLGLGPWFIEAGSIMILSHFFLGLPWDWGALLGSIIAAMAPAVVVACLFRLRTKGYGVAKGIPTLIIAVAGADDALSVAIFGIVKSLMFSNDSLTMQILQGPISIFGGLGFGFLWGVVCKYAPEIYDPFMVPLRIILLLVGGLGAVFGAELIGYDGAGPLGCVAAGFTCLYFWSKQGWDIEDNPAASAFEIFWMIFEPVMFGVTGTSIKLKELDPSLISIAVGILLTCFIIRILGTILLGIGCKLNLKEKIFVSLSWLPKAAVQAALGPIAWGLVKNTTPEKEDYARKVIMVCVLSIILTAPTGAILMTLLGKTLLTKTKFPEIPAGRRSHRPSIRDISIIDEEKEEEEEEKDAEAVSQHSTIVNETTTTTKND